MENKVTADYLDEEGCLHCGTCGKRKQMKVSLMGFEHVVSCLCECEVKARQELDEKMQREEEQRQLYQRKSVGLRERRFWEWKFENDNGSNQKILIARQYVENWTDMKRKNVGLLLMGPVGTGKSFFAGCIANALLEQGERVMMTNFSRILNEMTSYQADKNQIIQNLVDYPLLIIDDLGIERNSEFALEQVYNVIDSRYCKMLPLIITTNLGLNEMKSTDLDTAHQRIYSKGVDVIDVSLIDSIPGKYSIEDEVVMELMFLPMVNITYPVLAEYQLNERELYEYMDEKFGKYTGIEQKSKNKVEEYINGLREIEKEERIRLYINSVSKNMPIQMFVYLFDIFKQSTNGAIYKPIPYLGDIRLFIAEDTEKIVFHRSEEVINFWRENCIGDVTVIMIPGNHLTCFTDVNNIQKLVNKITEK